MLSPRLVSRAIALSLVTLLLIPACSDDDDPTGGGPADTTPPAVASVTPVDNTHIDVAFNENVERTSAETTGNYVIVQTIVLASGELDASGAGLAVQGAALHSDQRTVTLTTSSMNLVDYDMNISGVSDVNGNAIETTVTETFSGTDELDVTAPELVYRSPGPGATNVPVGAQILLTFSEPITEGSFFSGVTVSAGVDDLAYAAESEDGVHIAVTPLAPLELNTEYTVSVAGVEDEAGNTGADVEWTFRTTGTVDNTPPNFVSSSPANGATNVDVNTALSITFSEAINPMELGITAYPFLPDGDIVFTDGGRTLNYQPILPLDDDQQYTIAIVPGAIEDLSGNGNTSFAQIRFSTGATLAAGSFTGTLSGDATSNGAEDPTGATVFATLGDLLSLDNLQIAGSAVVAGDNTHDVLNLPDDDFFALSIKDTNGDGALDPLFGDALGAFGVDFGTLDTEPDAISILGGSRVTDVDFPLFDPSAISGTVAYSGIYADGTHFVGVGLFDAATFDPENPVPDYGFEAEWPGLTEWFFFSLEHGFPDGTYYVGAFLDANGNFEYDLGEPTGLYGGSASPTTITVDEGSDLNDVVIPIVDAPVALASTKAISWAGRSKREAPAWVRALSTAIQGDKAKSKW